MCRQRSEPPRQAHILCLTAATADPPALRPDMERPRRSIARAMDRSGTTGAAGTPGQADAMAGGSHSGRMTSSYRLEMVSTAKVAEVAELADALASGASGRKAIGVRVPASAPSPHRTYHDDLPHHTLIFSVTRKSHAGDSGPWPSCLDVRRVHDCGRNHSAR